MTYLPEDEAETRSGISVREWVKRQLHFGSHDDDILCDLANCQQCPPLLAAPIGQSERREAEEVA